MNIMIYMKNLKRLLEKENNIFFNKYIYIIIIIKKLM